MRILRACDRVAVPWKNGGGVTRELCAMPPGAGFDFAWRLSLAEVRKSGSFSRFADVDRRLLVLAGRMRLAVGRQESAMLCARSPALVFDGDAETFADVVEPVLDANLMTRRGVCGGTLERVAIDRAMTFDAGQGHTIIVAVDPVAAARSALAPLDAIWCAPGDGATVRPIGEAALVLVARIWPVASR